MDNLFFSQALATKLRRIKTCALSALEAPAGYGKTTAIRRLFGESDEAVCWFTAVEGMADNSFRWFIRQLGAVDETAARRLEDLGCLNRSNAGQAARILLELRSARPLTLVFDNFQFALQSWQPQVLDALAKCGEGGLRTVFISQNFGRLRDVVPDQILSKPGRLTAGEFEQMKRHAAEGGDVVRRVLSGITDEDYVALAADIATYHHERWDGTGYPSGLAGEAIPLSARIMAIADVFDALISQRCYKDAMRPERAFEIIEEEAGTHFDPRLARVFLDHRNEFVRDFDRPGAELCVEEHNERRTYRVAKTKEARNGHRFKSCQTA